MATKEQLMKAKQYVSSGLTPQDAAKKVIEEYKTPITPIAPIKEELETKIKSGSFSGADAGAYNKMVGDNQGARNLALTSKEGVQNLKTTVTPDEAVMMNNAGISNVGKGVTADLQGGTQEEYKQNVEKITTKTPEAKATNGLPQNIDEWKAKGSNLTTLEQMIENQYGTIATQENGKLVANINGDKYEWNIDGAGNPIKTNLGKVEQPVIESNPDVLFNQVIQGGVIDKTNPSYNEVTNRVNQYNQYKDLDQNQIASGLANGTILPGTTLYKDLEQNPEFKVNLQKASALNIINGVKTNKEEVFANQSETIANNTIVNIDGQEMTLKTALQDGFIDQNEYNTMTNSPVIFSKQEEVEDLKNKVDELQSIYDGVEDDLDERMKDFGTLSTTEKNVILANERKSLLGPLNLAISQYNNALGTLTQMKTDASQMFATNLGLYKEAEERTYNEKLAQKQLEQKFAYEYGDINSTDPNIQRVAIENAVAGMYENYPIVGMESQATKVQKVKDRIAQGMTGAEAIASVEQEIRNSPAYKDLMASQKEEMTPKETLTQDWSKLSDTELYNQKTGEIKSITPKQAGVIELQEGDEGGQCGTYARQYTGITTGLDAVVGTTAKDRIKSFTDNEPKEGGLVLFTGGNYDKQYGHIAVVTSVNGDGTINITESNLNNDGKVTNRVVGLDEVTGFYNDTPLAGGGKKDYTDNDIALLSSVAKLDKQGREVLKENGYTEQEWANFNAGLLPPTTSQKTEANKVIGLVNKLANHDGLNNAVGYKGPIGSFTTIAGTDKADFEALFNTLVDSLAASNLDKIKGAMSDKDIEFLRNIEKNGLNYDSSQKQFKEQLNELTQRYNAILTRGQTAQPTQTQSTYTSSIGKTYNLSDYK